MINSLENQSNALKKILVVGFSVTEMPSSYFAIAQHAARARGLDFELYQCGIGGITTESLPYFIDHILDAHPDCTHVVFEVASSYVRQVYAQHISYNPSYDFEIWKQIERLILSCHTRGKEAMFFNLPRKDVNYANDMLEAIIAKVCDAYATPVLSVSSEALLSKTDLSTLLLDEVHPSPLAAQLYSEKLLAFLARLPIPTVRNSYVTELRYDSIQLAAQCSKTIREFRRHGYRERYVSLKEGTPVRIDLGSPRNIEGFSVLCGPKSGMLYITTDIKREFFCYDEHCYYERMMTSVQPLGEAKTITFEMSSVVPDIELLKGQKNTEAREIGLFYLFTH